MNAPASTAASGAQRHGTSADSAATRVITSPGGTAGYSHPPRILQHDPGRRGQERDQGGEPAGVGRGAVHDLPFAVVRDRGDVRARRRRMTTSATARFSTQPRTWPTGTSAGAAEAGDPGAAPVSGR